ncbi:UNVERIFIED_CONTAM: hypothetical protein Slati_2477000 [Sesamum latifolium]|uniref:Uncharacterized protein n=1 Tax=Sesamum latifolium TaxID=2727402 RepID=A0AAW2WF48_9LAMI
MSSVHVAVQMDISVRRRPSAVQMDISVRRIGNGPNLGFLRRAARSFVVDFGPVLPHMSLGRARGALGPLSLKALVLINILINMCDVHKNKLAQREPNNPKRRRK